MYLISDNFINGHFKKIAMNRCERCVIPGRFAYGCSSYRFRECLLCSFNNLIRKYIFKQHFVNMETSINTMEIDMEKLTLDWDNDVYPKISKMTLLEFHDIIFDMKIHTYSKNFHIDNLLLYIDREIKNITMTEMTKMKEQLNDINDCINLIKDFLILQKK
jgi:hypothetical protein